VPPAFGFMCCPTLPLRNALFIGSDPSPVIVICLSLGRYGAYPGLIAILPPILAFLTFGEQLASTPPGFSLLFDAYCLRLACWLVPSCPYSTLVSACIERIVRPPQRAMRLLVVRTLARRDVRCNSATVSRAPIQTLRRIENLVWLNCSLANRHGVALLLPRRYLLQRPYGRCNPSGGGRENRLPGLPAHLRHLTLFSSLSFSGQYRGAWAHLVLYGGEGPASARPLIHELAGYLHCLSHSPRGWNTPQGPCPSGQSCT